MSLYPEVNKLSVNTEEAYVSVNKLSRRILKMYVGVNGKSQLFYDVIGTSIDTPSADFDIPENAIYLYNEGDECTDITGGWEVCDTDFSDYAYKRSSYLECSYDGNYDMSITTILSGFRTINSDIPLNKNDRFGVQYSFSCSETDYSDCYFTISRTGTVGGTVLLDNITPNGNSKNIVYADTNVDYGLSGISVDLFLYVAANYHPTTTLKIYKVWYEPYEEATS